MNANRIKTVRINHRNLKRVRLVLFRSNYALYASLVDDQKNLTITSASTLKMDDKQKPKEKAIQLGKKIAMLAKQHNIAEIVFDRGKYKYRGNIKALADSARESGLKF